MPKNDANGVKTPAERTTVKQFIQRMLGHQFVKYAIAGVVNTIFSYCVYALLIFIGLHFSLATFLQMVAAIIFNFYTFGKFVFKNSDKKLMMQFIPVSIVLYFVYTGGIKLLKINGFNDYISGAIMLAPTAVLSFVLNKYLVYENKWIKNRAKNNPEK
jgi:putative flippase GtrA